MNNTFKLGNEINLLKRYPSSKRNLKARIEAKSDNVREIARKFDKEFFDGHRDYGYGGFNYNPRYWSEVVKDFQSYWKLDSKSKVLDIGCAKGFMIYELKKLIPGINVKGIDISEYAINNCKKEVQENLSVGDAKNLNFNNNEFDVVISINSIHNLDREDCGKALREIQRVSKKNSFITVDAYRNENEKKRMYDWNLTAKTIMSVNEWKMFFKENNYTGDFFWFIP